MAKKSVAIIGLGPTGSFAARAAYDMGWDVKIYVHGNANVTPPGAFWLHWIPEGVLPDKNPETITVIGRGTEKEYIDLQWGKLANGFKSSFPGKQVIEKGYNPSEVLPHLVPAECELVPVAYKLSDADVWDIARAFTKVFQTFPTANSFATHPPLVPYVAAARMNHTITATHSNVVVYNGTGQGIVVREAQLFGNHYLEFPKNMDLKTVQYKHQLAGYQTIVLRDLDPHTKPVEQDPNNKVQLIGRFAEWDRKCLAHDAYKKVRTILERCE